MSDGTVSAYAADMEMGVIKTHDGKKYLFSKADWLSSTVTPEAGLIVTFEPTGSLAPESLGRGPRVPLGAIEPAR
jgi:hypothetical protein